MSDDTITPDKARSLWPLRVIIAAVIALGIVVTWYTHVLMTDRLTEGLRTRAEVRLAAYSGNLLSELRRTSIVPQLLARDPGLIGALNSQDFSRSSQRLIEVSGEIDIEGVKLLDTDGRVVAATDRVMLGTQHRSDPYFVEAIRAEDTVFTVNEADSGARQFTYSRKVEAEGTTVGVIVVEADLRQDRLGDLAEDPCNELSDHQDQDCEEQLRDEGGDRGPCVLDAG